jgi:hypothetical protein
MEILLRSHSGLRWLVLAAIVGAIVKSALSLSSGKAYDSLDNKLSLFALIFSHIQLLIGLALYMGRGWVSIIMDDPSTAMKEGGIRFWAVEHIFGMIIAIALITVGRIASKKAATDKAKFKKVLVYFSIGLIIMLAMIPWPFMESGAGRGWF